MHHRFVGFGFGPIQAGLFVAAAQKNGKFNEITVVEVDAELVEAMRSSNGSYHVNIAGSDNTYVETIHGVRLLNPTVEQDLAELKKALAQATEVATSLPSVTIYGAAGNSSPSALLAEALRCESEQPMLIYTAENNNHAAEILQEKISAAAGAAAIRRPYQVLNTVIGKMSQVITDEQEIERRGLAPIVPGFPRAFLVEEFNQIQVSTCTLPDFRPGIDAFEEKSELLPFEEAKLYGHNAIHALLGFLGAERGLTSMAALSGHTDSMNTARQAFIEEIGAALIAKHGPLGDPLFTKTGFNAYAEDLLERITNPHLDDAVGRAIRDPRRKLGYSDRIFGAIQLCLAQGMQPWNLARGAKAGLNFMLNNPQEYDIPANLVDMRTQAWTPIRVNELLDWLWSSESNTARKPEIAKLLL